MAIFTRVSGSHKEMSDCKVKVNGAWKQAVEAFVKVNGVWRAAWSMETVFVLESSTAFSATYTVAVSGINSTSNDVTLENVRFVVREDGSSRVTTYEKIESYNGDTIEYKTSNNATGVRITVTVKPTNTVEFFIDILRNNIDRVEFSFSDIYKS